MGNLISEVTPNGLWKSAESPLEAFGFRINCGFGRPSALADLPQSLQDFFYSRTKQPGNVL